MGSSKCRLCLGACFPCCILIGLVAIGGGIALYLEFPNIETQQINQKVTVEEGHATFEQLQSPTIDIYKDFYFFNLTNPEEFHHSHGATKPILTEIGPYSYRENRTKMFHHKSNDPDQRGYNQTKKFLFSPNTTKHGLKETDIICTINIPLVAAITTAEKKNSFIVRGALRTIIETAGAKLYICHPAKDLAWNYTDHLIKELHLAKQYPLKYVSIQVNNSADDNKTSIIHTGVKDISKIGEYIQWNGKKSLGIWNNTYANQIEGTEGFFFRPNLEEGDKLTAFVDDIQRSVNLTYVGKVQPLGLTALRYGIDNRTFKSAFTEPSNVIWGNYPFCPDGMFYLGPTQPLEIPVYGSKPYFLDGDPVLLDSVVGLAPPNRTLHDTVIDVEPTTGANLNFRRQLQINVQVNRTKSRSIVKVPMTELTGIKGYKDSGVLYYPVLYINERAEMDQAFKDYLEGKGLQEVQIFNIAVPVVFGVSLFVGVVCLLISMFSCAGFISRSRSDDDGAKTPLINPSA